MVGGQPFASIVIEILLPNVGLLADWGNVKRRTYCFAAVVHLGNLNAFEVFVEQYGCSIDELRHCSS